MGSMRRFHVVILAFTFVRVYTALQEEIVVPMIEEHQVALEEVTSAKKSNWQVLTEHRHWQLHLLANNFDL